MKYELEHCNCELCGENNFKVFWNKSDHKPLSVVIRDDDDKIIHGRNVICKKCGLVYISPRMTKESLDKFYCTEYRTIYGSNLQVNMMAEHNHALKATEILFGERIRRTFGPTRLLDVGASTGQMVGIFHQAMIQNNLAVQTTGIEASEEYSKVGKEQGLNIINEDFLTYKTENKFDIITILNTLEHMYSPTETLEKIHELLDVGGHVLISVPNIDNTLITRNLDAFLSNAHLYNFSSQTLVSLLQKTGFEPIRMYILAEEIGEKLYALAKKAEPVDVDFSIIDPMVADRIRMARLISEVANIKIKLMGQEAKE